MVCKENNRYFRVYVIECETSGYFYVGSTVRLPHEREQEHREGWGSHWTSRHGFKRMLVMEMVPGPACDRLEDDDLAPVPLRVALCARRQAYRNQGAQVAKVAASLQSATWAY